MLQEAFTVYTFNSCRYDDIQNVNNSPSTISAVIFVVTRVRNCLQYHLPEHLEMKVSVQVCQ